MYKYLTETISYCYGLIKKNLTIKLQELLDKRASEGWRLVKYDFLYNRRACVVVFEREV